MDEHPITYLQRGTVPVGTSPSASCLGHGMLSLHKEAFAEYLIIDEHDLDDPRECHTYIARMYKRALSHMRAHTHTHPPTNKLLLALLNWGISVP